MSRDVIPHQVAEGHSQLFCNRVFSDGKWHFIDGRHRRKFLRRRGNETFLKYLQIFDANSLFPHFDTSPRSDLFDDEFARDAGENPGRERRSHDRRAAHKKEIRHGRFADFSGQIGNQNFIGALRLRLAQAENVVEVIARFPGGIDRIGVHPAQGPGHTDAHSIAPPFFRQRL